MILLCFSHFTAEVFVAENSFLLKFIDLMLALLFYVATCYLNLTFHPLVGNEELPEDLIMVMYL